ncbi:ice-binding family protein [Geopsychrobacter electrodiphilus]|uniref:ice-binding family protein n=1 Tax=Geopsychrobacter electrodiphilus TaxID=225196 RepID=UPI0003A3083D|nr:ice-binding family protein [Geopsychrobacter electrodiphilus]
MKKLKVGKVYLVLMVMLSVIFSSSLVFAGSQQDCNEHRDDSNRHEHSSLVYADSHLHRKHNNKEHNNNGNTKEPNNDNHSNNGNNNPPSVPPVVLTPNVLGSASLFGVFGGGAGMTNQGILTVVNGDIGTTAASTLITGFHDSNAVFTETPLNIGAVNGTVHTATAPFGSVPNAIATAAALDAQIAFDNLSPATLPGGMDVSAFGGGAGELGNRTLSPGVYLSAPGSFAIQGGDLTLDAAGNANAIWVFQMATTLTVGSPGFPQSVVLVNGAQAKNVFWQVGSAATINAAGGGTMAGTIIAYSGASFSTAGNVVPVTLNGRVLALHASVTLVNTLINVPAP